jgi:predicted phosphodiesterase
MGSYGELVLVCGDMHLGTRVAAIPPAFAAILLPGKMAHVLCTGNAGLAPSAAAQAAGAGAGEGLDFLRTLAPRLHAVRGDCDDDGACVALSLLPALLPTRAECVRVRFSRVRARASTASPFPPVPALPAPPQTRCPRARW